MFLEIAFGCDVYICSRLQGKITMHMKQSRNDKAFQVLCNDNFPFILSTGVALVTKCVMKEKKVNTALVH